MGQGIQVFNAAGQLIFDTPDRLSRIIGKVVVAPGASGSITLPTGYGDYYFFVWPSSGTTRYTPVITLSGNTLSYSPATIWTPAVECTIFYGVK